jgi:hypothetical protein
MPAIQFTCFDQVKALYIARLNDGSTQLSLAAGFVIGAIARTLADVVSYPVRVPQNIQQSSKHPLRYVHTRCCRLTPVERSARYPFAFLLIDNELNRSGERESHAVTTWHGVAWCGRDASFGTIVSSVLRSEGISGLYKGIVPQLSQGTKHA